MRRIAASRTAEGEERLHDEWLHRHPGPVQSVEVTRTPGTVDGEVEILGSAPREMENTAMFNDSTLLYRGEDMAFLDEWIGSLGSKMAGMINASVSGNVSRVHAHRLALTQSRRVRVTATNLDLICL